ncbi:uncharacterized protein LOC120619176 [Pteropus medius]|uniref:uncharacterized protein LOC120619176 n=1 Tax=Pteropus vampyrus TaxID=132908 RepID=UPI00196B04E7|nr:uncharacterized protein LOC120619176 [Pteropus giganteus]
MPGTHCHTMSFTVWQRMPLMMSFSNPATETIENAGSTKAHPNRLGRLHKDRTLPGWTRRKIFMKERRCSRQYFQARSQADETPTQQTVHLIEGFLEVWGSEVGGLPDIQVVSAKNREGQRENLLPPLQYPIKCIKFTKITETTQFAFCCSIPGAGQGDKIGARLGGARRREDFPPGFEPAEGAGSAGLEILPGRDARGPCLEEKLLPRRDAHPQSHVPSRPGYGSGEI